MTVQDDLFFLRQVSNRLRLFKQVDRYKFSFRCWYCGDSKKDEYATRGTFYPQEDHLQYGCFNCGKQVRFSKFLQDFDSTTYRDYLRHKFHGGSKPEPKREKVKPEDVDFPVLFKLTKVFPITASPKAMTYLRSRFVRNTADMYYTNDASEVIGKYKLDMKPEKVARFEGMEAILFPLMTMERAVVGVQLRFLEGEFRYMTLKFHDDFAKLYLTPGFDPNKEIWTTEGVFDALMLPNGLANLDASLSRVTDRTLLPKDRFVLVHDNEPRNEDVMKEMKDSVEKGFRVFFWPRWAKDYGKDLNDIRKENENAFNRLMKERNSFVKSGLQAKLEMQKFLANS